MTRPVASSSASKANASSIAQSSRANRIPLYVRLVPYDQWLRIHADVSITFAALKDEILYQAKVGDTDPTLPGSAYARTPVTAIDMTEASSADSLSAATAVLPSGLPKVYTARQPNPWKACGMEKPPQRGSAERPDTASRKPRDAKDIVKGDPGTDGPGRWPFAWIGTSRQAGRKDNQLQGRTKTEIASQEAPRRATSQTSWSSSPRGASTASSLLNSPPQKSPALSQARTADASASTSPTSAVMFVESRHAQAPVLTGSASSPQMRPSNELGTSQRNHSPTKAIGGFPGRLDPTKKRASMSSLAQVMSESESPQSRRMGLHQAPESPTQDTRKGKDRRTAVDSQIQRQEGSQGEEEALSEDFDWANSSMNFLSGNEEAKIKEEEARRALEAMESFSTSSRSFKLDRTPRPAEISEFASSSAQNDPRDALSGGADQPSYTPNWQSVEDTTALAASRSFGGSSAASDGLSPSRSGSTFERSEYEFSSGYASQSPSMFALSIRDPRSRLNSEGGLSVGSPTRSSTRADSEVGHGSLSSTSSRADLRSNSLAVYLGGPDEHASPSSSLDQHCADESRESLEDVDEDEALGSGQGRERSGTITAKRPPVIELGPESASSPPQQPHGATQMSLLLEESASSADDEAGAPSIAKASSSSRSTTTVPTVTSHPGTIVPKTSSRALRGNLRIAGMNQDEISRFQSSKHPLAQHFCLQSFGNGIVYSPFTTLAASKVSAYDLLELQFEQHDERIRLPRRAGTLPDWLHQHLRDRDRAVKAMQVSAAEASMLDESYMEPYAQGWMYVYAPKASPEYALRSGLGMWKRRWFMLQSRTLRMYRRKPDRAALIRAVSGAPDFTGARRSSEAEKKPASSAGIPLLEWRMDNVCWVLSERAQGATYPPSAFPLSQDLITVGFSIPAAAAGYGTRGGPFKSGHFVSFRCVNDHQALAWYKIFKRAHFRISIEARGGLVTPDEILSHLSAARTAKLAKRSAVTQMAMEQFCQEAREKSASLEVEVDLWRRRALHRSILAGRGAVVQRGKVGRNGGRNALAKVRLRPSGWSRKMDDADLWSEESEDECILSVRRIKETSGESGASSAGWAGSATSPQSAILSGLQYDSEHLQEDEVPLPDDYNFDTTEREFPTAAVAERV